MITLIYSVVVMLFGTAYQKLAYKHLGHLLVHWEAREQALWLTLRALCQALTLVPRQPA